MNRRQQMLSVLAAVVAVAGFVSTTTAQAITLQCSGGAVCAEARNPNKFDNIVTDVISTLLVVVGIVAVLMIVMSGIRYITANGDANRIQAAKNTLLYSVIGLVVAIMAYSIVWFVTRSIG